jgi:hypothetical protein
MILEGENYRFQRELGAKGAFRLHLGLHLAWPAGPLSCECEVCLRLSAVSVRVYPLGSRRLMAENAGWFAAGEVGGVGALWANPYRGT